MSVAAGGVPVALAPFGRRHLAATLEWTNDASLARLLDRARRIDPEEHERWFAALASRTDTRYFAIEVGATCDHVGNVWLADIDTRHLKAEVRVVVGREDATGRGVGSRAIDLMARHAFDALGLHRVYAYVLTLNPRAKRAFEKAGFTLEGVLRDDRRTADGFTDVFLLAKVAH
jgi:RimJ/RimL family protein N-acetyltransferase